MSRIFERTKTEAFDLEKARIKIYTADQPSGFGDDGREPGPLHGKRVLQVQLEGLPPKIVELPPALDALVEQALSDHAADHGLAARGGA